MAFGITSTGFVIKRLPDILISMQDKAKVSFGESINLAEDSVLGQVLSIVGAEIADCWEGAHGAYNAAYPSTSEGINLDNASSMIGIDRLAEQRTAVQLKLTANVGTVVQAGSLFEQTGSGQRFLSVTETTMTATPVNGATVNIVTLQNSTAYTITIGGTARTYTSDGTATQNEIIAGLVAALNAPAFGVTAVDNGNGTLSWFLAGVEERSFTVTANLGVASVSKIIAATADEVGPVDAAAGTIVTMKTPLFGFISVTNPVAGNTGRFEETDAELRQRRAESVSITGSGTMDAIRSKLRQIPGVTNAVVIENATNAVDGAGRPAKSFECVVEGGVNQAIGDVVWATKPAGIESHGGVSVSVTDSVGGSHTVKFSRPTNVYIHFNVTVTQFSEEAFPSDGADQIKKIMVETGEKLAIGNDVILQRFLGPIYSQVQGISNIAITVATSNDGITPGAYTTNNVSITSTQVPLFATSRVAVTVV